MAIREAGPPAIRGEGDQWLTLQLDTDFPAGIDEGLVPVEGSTERIAEGLSALAESGADEVILVLSPITERSIRSMGEALALLD